MKIRVLFFSVLKDLSGSEERTVVLSLGAEGDATMGDLLEQIYREIPGMEVWDERLLLAVNAEFANRDSVLREGDEVALMPPVQGG
ncbi:MAG: MoaD/ThiS family protein [Verrucomicrobiales bacterium]|jgi:molybdopterin converting factor small subunit|nr:MoaD/ThiS family protein [Verrucomicrobiales bacterium]MBP9226154.1 MoaD/ThiS family protein [Verrucomicrobiales bacterium]